MNAKKQPVTYAFIDGQNLKMGVETDIKDRHSKQILYKGWKLDYGKLLLYLKHKYGVSRAYLFMGEIPGNEWLYKKMRSIGYTVVLKPSIPYKEGGNHKTKGNVDAELVLHAGALTYNQYDRAVIVSGDGDFSCLHEYLEAQGKLYKILAPNFRYSSLINKYANRIVILGEKRGILGKAPQPAQSRQHQNK